MRERRPMNKSQLIETLAKSENLALKKAEEVVNTVFGDMENALIKAKGSRLEALVASRSRNTRAIKAEIRKPEISSTCLQKNSRSSRSVKSSRTGWISSGQPWSC
jgi:nucleoid DNA-binding protein